MGDLAVIGFGSHLCFHTSASRTQPAQPGDALDMMSVLGIGIVVVYAVVTNQPVFVDVASVLALVSFLGTVAFAAYVEMRS